MQNPHIKYAAALVGLACVTAGMASSHPMSFAPASHVIHITSCFCCRSFADLYRRERCWFSCEQGRTECMHTITASHAQCACSSLPPIAL